LFRVSSLFYCNPSLVMRLHKKLQEVQIDQVSQKQREAHKMKKIS